MENRVSQVWQDRATVAYRAPELYTVAPHNVFNITGPVIITVLGGMQTGAAGAGSTCIFAINGVAPDAAAVAVDGGIGLVFASCLNVAGTLVNAAGVPLTDALLHSKGFLAGNSVGTITATFAVDTWTGELFCVYRKLAPYSSINVA